MKLWLVLVAGLAAGPAWACRGIPESDMPDTVRSDPAFDVQVWYETPTTEYQHGILGDAIEAKRIRLMTPRVDSALCSSATMDAGEGHVFEDEAPRLADLNGDGRAEVIAVRSSVTEGAQLVVYEEVPGATQLRLLASTPYIGRRNRWLAPIGAADLDGDGVIEIAYIDRPHLAKVLRIVRVEGDQLIEVASAGGVTNHRIGERDIGGGIRVCAGAPQMIVASADWSSVLAVAFDGSSISATDLGPYEGRQSFAKALDCNR